MDWLKAEMLYDNVYRALHAPENHSGFRDLIHDELDQFLGFYDSPAKGYFMIGDFTKLDPNEVVIPESVLQFRNLSTASLIVPSESPRWFL